MNFNDLENSWGHQIVIRDDRPIAAALSRRLDSEIRHERRRVLGGIAVVAFALLVGWMVTIGFHFAGIVPINRMSIVSLTLGSAIDLVFFVLAFRSAQRIQAEVQFMGGTLRESVGASLRTIESRIRDTVFVAYGLPTAALIGNLLLVAKYFTGDMRGLGVIVGSTASLLFAGAIVAAMWWRYRHHLLPRRDELRRLVASLEETN